MFFFTSLKKKGNKSHQSKINCFLVLLFAFVINAPISATSDLIDSEEKESFSELIPEEWQEDIMMPNMVTSIVIIEKGPAASGIPGNTDFVIRYGIENTGDETLFELQVDLSLATQLGTSFVGLTGSLSAVTGSGSALPPAPTSVFNGSINDLYDAIANDSLFNPSPDLAPNEYIYIDIPFEVGDTVTTGAISINAVSTGRDGLGNMLSTTSSPLVLTAGCQSESLACAGKVNVTLGPDCLAEIGLSTVFLNDVVDPNRYSVEVYQGNVALGTTLNESHVGTNLTYRVFDACAGNASSCWGEINLENKNLPMRSSTYQEIYCGEDPQILKSLTETINDIANECFIDITSITEDYNTDGSKCTGYLTTRVVTGEYEVDGWKRRDTIHVDTIRELPLELDSVLAPIGGPETSDAIVINCDEIGPDGPTPDFIVDYYNALPASTGSGIAFGYPHINRGFTTMEMYESRDTVVEYITLEEIDIDGVTVTVRVINKDTLTITDTTFLQKPDLVAIPRGTTCNLTVTYKDEFFDGCAGPETKIQRNWSILNWCTGDLVNFDQWIILEDTTGPSITIQDTVEVGITPWTCLATLDLEAEVMDNCSGVRNLNWSASAGVIDSSGTLTEITTSDSPVRVELQAIDECGNESIGVMIVHVVDRIAPVAIARDQITTNIVYDPVEDRGFAKITAESINGGSHDSDCGPITTCILLDEELANPIFKTDGTQATDSLGNLLYHAVQCEIDGEYEGQPYVICKEAVKLCCDQTGDHRVALIVNDMSPLSGPGIGWGVVTVEDKSIPIVECQTINATCGDDLNPAVIGFPNISNGICGDVDLAYFDVENLNDCGNGSVQRTWIVNGDTTCTQAIIISSEESFDPKGIKWPKHYDDETIIGVRRVCENDTIVESLGVIEMGTSFICGENVLTEPVWCTSTCSNVFMSFEDVNVEAGDGCKKIIRNWTVIDWCNYTPNGNDPDKDDDSFEAVYDETSGLLSDLQHGDECATCDKPSSQIGEDTYFRYTEVDVDGFYNFEQVIKITDNTPPVVDAPEEVTVEITDGAVSKFDNFAKCTNDVNVTAYAVELCGDIVLDANDVRWEIEVINDEGTVIAEKTTFGDSAVMNSGNGLPNNIHTIKWYVSDGCGNQGSGETEVAFVDVVAPTPLCISSLSTATMDVTTGEAVIWASDFDKDSYDNCGPIKTFFKNADGTATSSLVFTCEDIPDGQTTVKQLELFVSDESGNESSCNISIRIDDNNDVCPDSLVGEATISGVVMTFKQDMIENAIVSLNARENNFTDVNGQYFFSDVPMASSYKITGTKDDDHLNGVSTLDLVLIQRHILALDTIDSAYNIIAADVNGDTRISAIDLVQLRRLILGLTSNFPNNESWRFIDPTQVFENELKPFPFIEEIVIQDLNQNMNDQNLLGIKIGDVSGNAIANSLVGQNRSAENEELILENVMLEKNQLIEIPVVANSEIAINGLQFTLDLSHASIKAIRAGSMNVTNSNYVIHDNNTASFSWSAAEAIDADEALFYLSILPSRDVALEEVLHINNHITSSELITNDLTSYGVELSFESKFIDVEEFVFNLEQNEPNPFSEATNIGFTLGQDDVATLTVYNLSGQVIYQVKGEYTKGYNEITLSKSDLNARGLLFYKLESAGYTDTRKMILLE